MTPPLSPSSCLDDVVIYATRNFQNTARIYRQHANSTHASLSAIQWLRKSHYTDQMIVSEQNQCLLFVGLFLFQGKGASFKHYGKCKRFTNFVYHSIHS